MGNNKSNKFMTRDSRNAFAGVTILHYGLTKSLLDMIQETTHANVTGIFSRKCCDVSRPVSK